MGNEGGPAISASIDSNRKVGTEMSSAGSSSDNRRRAGGREGGQEYGLRTTDYGLRSSRGRVSSVSVSVSECRLSNVEVTGRANPGRHYSSAAGRHHRPQRTIVCLCLTASSRHRQPTCRLSFLTGEALALGFDYSPRRPRRHEGGGRNQIVQLRLGLEV